MTVPRPALVAGVSALVVLAAAIGVGVGWWFTNPLAEPQTAASVPASPSPSPSPSPIVVPSPTPTKASLPQRVESFATYVCSLKTAPAGFENAAPYTGSGPHPIVFGLAHDGSISWPDWPSAWLTEDPTKVQLVGCVAVKPGAFIRNCEYTGKNGKTTTVGLYHAEYTIYVYTTATGELVATVPLRGADTDCPGAIFVPAGGPHDEYATMTTGQVRKALGPYVD